MTQRGKQNKTKVERKRRIADGMKMLQVTLPTTLIDRLHGVWLKHRVVPRDVIQTCLESPKTLTDFERSGGR